MVHRTLLSLLLPTVLACDDAEPTAPRARPPASVPPLPVARYLTITPAKASMNTGEQLRFDVLAQDEQRRALPAVAVTWSSGDTSIATVDHGGVVLARTAGYVGIGAVSGGASAFALLQIGVNGEYPTGVLVEPATATLTACSRFTFRARTDPDINDTRFRWTSSDTMVLRVEDTGAVRGVAAGTARLTVVWLPDPSRTTTRDLTVTPCPR